MNKRIKSDIIDKPKIKKREKKGTIKRKKDKRVRKDGISGSARERKKDK